MMRSIVITVMLIIVVVVLYDQIFGIEDGVIVQLQQQGNELNEDIEGIDLYGEGAVL